MPENIALESYMLGNCVLESYALKNIVDWIFCGYELQVCNA
jgi:hypothetical protein